jgi:hypothetical protein
MWISIASFAASLCGSDLCVNLQSFHRRQSTEVENGREWLGIPIACCVVYQGRAKQSLALHGYGYPSSWVFETGTRWPYLHLNFDRYAAELRERVRRNQ